MELGDVFHVLWHQRRVFLAVFFIVSGATVAALFLQTKSYQATATLSLTPTNSTNGVEYMLNPNVIVPLYAESIQAGATQQIASKLLHHDLANISVQTYTDTPILKINAVSSHPDLASQSAQAIVDAVMQRANSGRIGVSGLSLVEIDRPSVSAEAVSPQVKLSLAIAVLLGLGFAVGAALVRGHFAPSKKSPAHAPQTGNSLWNLAIGDRDTLSARQQVGGQQ